MVVREKPLQHRQDRTRNLLKAHFSQLKPNGWPKQATFCACVCTFLTWIQSWALNVALSFRYWQDVVHANVSKKWVLRILCTKDLEMSDTDDLKKGMSFTEATNMNKQPPKIPMITSHWAVGCTLTSDSKLMANKRTPRPEPRLQTELQTLKPRTDMTKLLIQKEKRVPHFLLSRVVILISSIFQVIIVLE